MGQVFIRIFFSLLFSIDKKVSKIIGYGTDPRTLANSKYRLPKNQPLKKTGSRYRKYFFFLLLPKDTQRRVSQVDQIYIRKTSL